MAAAIVCVTLPLLLFRHRKPRALLSSPVTDSGHLYSKSLAVGVVYRFSLIGEDASLPQYLSPGRDEHLPDQHPGHGIGHRPGQVNRFDRQNKTANHIPPERGRQAVD
ncbi:hypothetical protein FTO74_14900 [Granulicella sp. WH15]|uniref:hypothetical protein n=1 Tax=Granulicella sp. WH15 TaxID=2602070 RepID=UPI001366CEFD|nr:hypothetical protein [Granulicella sp. WH15]QHN04505.1 hypothetical protein FTO74_14900 [Granulicella sp. WH15]